MATVRQRRPGFGKSASISGVTRSAARSVSDPNSSTAVNERRTPGDIFLAPFLYADLGEVKRRPVCVVSGAAFNRGSDLIVAMVTSRTVRRSSPGVGDVPLEDWKDAGLLAPSTVRTGRLQTLEERLLQGQLGSLRQRDLDSINAALRAVLELA